MQAPAPVHAFPYAYIGGWVTLLYLAVARRLPLRAHLLLIMPELAMQATACAAASVYHHDSIGLPSSYPQGLFQVRPSQLTPLADCYHTSMQPTACAAASVYHHDSISLPSSYPQGLFQARLLLQFVSCARDPSTALKALGHAMKPQQARVPGHWGSCVVFAEGL